MIWKKKHDFRSDVGGGTHLFLLRDPLERECNRRCVASALLAAPDFSYHLSAPPSGTFPTRVSRHIFLFYYWRPVLMSPALGGWSTRGLALLLDAFRADAL